MKTAVITLENMEFYAFHGCYREEQVVGNRFRVDLSIEVDVTQASSSDSVSDTVNYLEVYRCIRAGMMVKSHILEHLATRLLDALKSDFPEIVHARIKVSKMAPPLGGQVESVSVEMEA